MRAQCLGSIEGRISGAEVVIKPVFLKAGIPLVLSVAGFVCVRLIKRRCTIVKDTSTKCKLVPLETNLESKQDIKNEASNNLDDTPLHPIKDDEEDLITTSSSDEDKGIPEEEIVSLKGRIEKIENRESHLGRLVLQYHVMKEHESALMELGNVLLLETTRLEFLGREISLIESEKQMFENFVMEFLKLVKKLTFVKLENGLLRMKVKKFLRRTKRQSHVIWHKNSKIGDAESELLSCHQEVEMRDDVIKKLKDQVRVLQDIVNNMQEEKNELMVKLNSAESSALSISKIETGMRMEDYNELDQLRRDRAAAVAELSQLRGTNAFLRHELLRTQKQLHYQLNKNKHRLEREQWENVSPNRDRRPENQCHDGSASDHKGPDLSSEVKGSTQCAPKRKNMLRKIKRWVEGGESLKSKLDLEAKGTKSHIGVPILVNEEDVDRSIYCKSSVVKVKGNKVAVTIQYASNCVTKEVVDQQLHAKGAISELLTSIELLSEMRFACLREMDERPKMKDVIQQIECMVQTLQQEKASNENALL